MRMQDAQDLRPLSSSRRLRRYSTQLAAQRHAWELGLPSYIQPPEGVELPAIIAVGGGKGGVGKSFLSANISARLASAGYRVLAIDLDLGCANLHTHLGVPRPQATLVDFVVSGRFNFAEILTPTSVTNLAIIAGGQEASWGRFLAHGTESLMVLWDEIFHLRQNFAVDFVVLDLGAGTLTHTMEFFTVAHLGLVTVLPEPTSIENAYVFLKSFLWQMIDQIAQRTHRHDMAADLRAALDQVKIGPSTQGYSEVMQQMMQTYPEFIQDLNKCVQAHHLGLVVNQTRTQQDINLGPSMELICRRYFNLPVKFLGDLNYDEAAWKSLRNRKLLAQDFPHAQLTRKMAQLVFHSLAHLGFYQEIETPA